MDIKALYQPQDPLPHTTILFLFKKTPLEVQMAISQQNGSGQNELPE